MDPSAFDQPYFSSSGVSNIKKPQKHTHIHRGGGSYGLLFTLSDLICPMTSKCERIFPLVVKNTRVSSIDSFPFQVKKIPVYF